jgi:glutamate racemase
MKSSIGIFDSGYGGLTVLKAIREQLPNYDYIYLGDNARAPYGTRSFDVVYQYTLEAIKYLFSLECQLIILACNTASAKALRTIQQNDLPDMYPERRVLGVLRPTTEEIGNYTKSGFVGVLGTAGTVRSNSYVIEIDKFFPSVKVTQQSCPMWVPLVENNSFMEKGGQYFIEKYIDEILTKQPDIDTLILACTHYPLLKESILKYVPQGVNVIDQGALVAEKLKDYLERHSVIENKLSKNNQLKILTTEKAEKFDQHLDLFYNSNVKSSNVTLH